MTAGRRISAPASGWAPSAARAVLWLLVAQLLACGGNQHAAVLAQAPTARGTAYLVASMLQATQPANNSFNSLYGILQQLDTYSTIVLTEDYDIANSKEFADSDPVKLTSNLTITSEPGEFNQLGFGFVNNAVFMNNHTVTLRRMAVQMARKTSGQSLPFFEGEGSVRLIDVVRVRIACSSLVNTSIKTLRSTPRPPGLPGEQLVDLVDFSYRGQLYPGSVRVEDVALFVSPSDVEDGAYYAGYSVVQKNVTRVCKRYVPASCSEVCLQQTVDATLAAQAAQQGGGGALVASVVPPVVVGSALLAAAAIGALLWHRRRRRHAVEQQHLLVKQQQQQQLGPDAQHEHSHRAAQLAGRPVGSRPPLFYYSNGSTASSVDILQRQLAAAAYGTKGVPVGLLGRSEMVAVGSIEEVAVGGPSVTGQHKGWHLMACHTAPEFPEATAKDAISLGVLLGAGSFGRVYRGRWRGLDVAVKILHHDVNTAAAVANEVDLVMSFRHPNITTAYHFLTWNYAHDSSDELHSSDSLRRTSSAAAGAGAGAAAAAAAAGATPPGQPQGRSLVPLQPAAAGGGGGGSSGGGHRAGSSGSGSLRGGPEAQHAQQPLLAPPPQQQQQQQQQPPPVATPAGVLSPTAAAMRTPVQAPPLRSLPSEPLPSSQQQHSGSHAGSGAGAGAGGDAGAVAAFPDWGPGRLMPAWDSLRPTNQPMGDSGMATEWAVTSQTAAAQQQQSQQQPQRLPPFRQGSSGHLQPATPQLQHQQLPSPPQQQPQPQQPQQPQPPPQQQQLQQQPQQQEFIPMLRHQLPPGADAGRSAQQPQYVPYVPAPATTNSHSGDHAAALHMPSSQQQQQQRALHPLSPTFGSSGSGGGGDGSSYVCGGGGGGAGRARARAGTLSGEAQTWLILELADAGTLLDLMQERGNIKLAHVLTLLCDVAAGMGYLHSRNCVHGDLKPANVLLKQQQGVPFGHVAKVSDFGLTRSLTAGQSHRSTRTLGTFNRAPPELLRLGRLSPACDTYAFGVLMWELFTGQVAFGGAHYGEVFERVALLQERPPIPPDMPPQYEALMVACWAADPLARPTFDTIQQALAAILREMPDTHERFVSDL